MFDLWLIHPDEAMCAAFRHRFEGLPHWSVRRSLYEDLPPHDCFVTAGNSFGIMNAGIDAAVVHVLGRPVMDSVQLAIMDRLLGEQPVGTAFVVETGHPERPYLVHAPTMRMPGSIRGTANVYAATWAALLAALEHRVDGRRRIGTVVVPAMGTGFGDVPFDEAARQMAVAWRHFHDPPHRLDWDFAIARHRAIAYDGDRRVVS